MSLPIAQMHANPDGWRAIMARIEQANARGGRMGAQALPRGIGLLFGLDLSAHPFFLRPSYRQIADLPIAERLARLRDPQLRARILSEQDIAYPFPIAQSIGQFEWMFEVGSPFHYEPLPEESIAARALARGEAADALAYDLLLDHGGQAALYMPFANYANRNLDTALEMFRHPDIVLGLGDGGAHYGLICDASYSTFLLSYWTRDRTRGERLTVPEAIRALCHDTARLVGLEDRGVIATGYNADINIIDYANLQLAPPRVAFDLPEQGRRLTQRASGYVATIVNGTVVYRHGEATGALPGTVVRGRRGAPPAAAARALASASDGKIG